MLAFAVDATGAVYAAAHESSGAGGRPIGSKYLYKLDPSGRIAWAFPLAPAIASVRAIAVDIGGSAYVAGTAVPGLATTAGVVYPTTNRSASLVTPYLLKVDAAGQRTVYQTYLSQFGQRAFPLVNQFFPTVFPPASNGAYLMEVAASGTSTLFATTFGGGADGGVQGLTADGFGSLCLAGYTGVANFPTLASLQGSPAGTNAFLAKVSDAAIPVTLDVSANPAASETPLLLTARVAASRDQGTVEFRDGATVLGTSPIAGGSASLTVSLAAGVHSLTAVYFGPGFFDSVSSPIIFEIVNNTGCN